VLEVFVNTILRGIFKERFPGEELPGFAPFRDTIIPKSAVQNSTSILRALEMRTCLLLHFPYWEEASSTPTKDTLEWHSISHNKVENPA
jgi:hypothetical protein